MCFAKKKTPTENGLHVQYIYKCCILHNGKAERNIDIAINSIQINFNHGFRIRCHNIISPFHSSWNSEIKIKSELVRQMYRFWSLEDMHMKIKDKENLEDTDALPIPVKIWFEEVSTAAPTWKLL